MYFNSLWLSDAIWWQKSGSTLAQVMACCLTAPSHYLNQPHCTTSPMEGFVTRLSEPKEQYQTHQALCTRENKGRKRYCSGWHVVLNTTSSLCLVHWVMWQCILCICSLTWRVGTTHKGACREITISNCKRCWPGVSLSNMRLLLFESYWLMQNDDMPRNHTWGWWSPNGTVYTLTGNYTKCMSIRS